jgi:hypothetical protein
MPKTKKHLGGVARWLWRKLPWQSKPLVVLAGLAMVLYLIEAVVSMFR